MSTSTSGNLRFEFSFSHASARAPRDPEAPLRILILADFGARAHRNLREPLGGRRIQSVDMDRLDQVLGSFQASLTLPPADASAHSGILQFESLDDFHPDQLLQRIPPLAKLLAVRNRLNTPATAAQGAEELERLLGTPASTVPSGAAGVPSVPESADDTLARLLGGTPRTGPSVPAKREGAIDIQSIIRNIVGPAKTAPAPPAGLAGLLAAADLELSARLRAVLHHPDFQAVESAWRSLDWLLRRCPDEERIHYFALNATLDEVSGDLPGLHRLLRDQPPDLLVANCTFGSSQEDLAALGALASLAGSLGVSLLAAAHPQLVSCDSFARHPDPDDWQLPLAAGIADAWDALRHANGAGHLRLAAPRFLLRQPYGAGSESIDTFAFQEIPNPSDHEAFLWGNPAFLLALRHAQAAVEGAEPSGGEIDGLPVFQYKEDGEAVMKPCAEAWLTERAVARLAASGVVPVWSVKGRDAVLLAAI